MPVTHSNSAPVVTQQNSVSAPHHNTSSTAASHHHPTQHHQPTSQQSTQQNSTSNTLISNKQPTVNSVDHHTHNNCVSPPSSVSSRASPPVSVGNTTPSPAQQPMMNGPISNTKVRISISDINSLLLTIVFLLGTRRYVFVEDYCAASDRQSGSRTS